MLAGDADTATPQGLFVGKTSRSLGFISEFISEISGIDWRAWGKQESNGGLGCPWKAAGMEGQEGLVPS